MSDAIERAAEAIYNLFPYDEPRPTPEKPAWVPNGNSWKQDEARRYAAVALSTAPQALAATPAVGGERECPTCLSNPAIEKQCSDPWHRIPSQEVMKEGLSAAIRAANLALFVIRKQGVMPNSSWESGFDRDMETARSALAAQPASPLRGREYLAPSPCSDLSIGELIEWLDNPQWTNGYLNSDAANHMSAAAELIERLVSSAPPEQPAADPAFKWGLDYGNDLLKDINQLAHAAGTGALHRDVLQRSFREIKRLTITEPRRSSGEPIREDNYMSNDLDKGDDA